MSAFLIKTGLSIFGLVIISFGPMIALNPNGPSILVQWFIFSGIWLAFSFIIVALAIEIWKEKE